MCSKYLAIRSLCGEREHALMSLNLSVGEDTIQSVTLSQTKAHEH